MRILQVIPYFYPAWTFGGPVKVAYQLSKELAKKGHDVTVYTTDALTRNSTQKSRFLNVNGVKVHYFRNVSNALAYDHKIFLSPGIFSLVKKEIRWFDIIHLHDYRTFQNVVIHHYARKHRIPYILQAQGSVLRIIEKQRLKKIYDMFWGYKILEDTSRVIAVSNTEVGQYKQLGVSENKIVVISNGIDIESFKNLPERKQFKKKYHIREKYMILFLGRVHRIKGIDFLIKSFSKLVKEIDDVALVIAGPDDGYGRKAKILTKNLDLHDKVRFTGWINGKDKLSAYVDANVLIYPSIFEIFGLVPFEAIMCGTPVIVTNDCGCGELINEAKAGYTVKYGDVEVLKEKMRRAIKNPDEGLRMVERGKRYIEEKLGWDRITRKLEELYGNCLHQPSSGL